MIRFWSGGVAVRYVLPVLWMTVMFLGAVEHQACISEENVTAGTYCVDSNEILLNNEDEILIIG